MANRFIAVTFYTEGPPWDAGTPLADAERHFRAAVEPHVDEVRSFCPRSMSALWPDAERYCRDYSQWLDHHPLRHELRHYNRGWAKAGFFSWKPFLLHALLHDEMILPGDVIFYHDVNFQKYPAYARTPAEWRDVSLRILDELGCDIFCAAGLRLESDAKAFLVRRYLRESAGLDRGVRASLIIFRKSRQSLEFVDEWKPMCDDLDNISPLPNPKPYAGALWHSPEQSALGVLALKWKQEGRLPAEWPLYAAGDLSFDSTIFNRTLTPPKAYQRWLYGGCLALPYSLQSALLSAVRGVMSMKSRFRGNRWGGQSDRERSPDRVEFPVPGDMRMPEVGAGLMRRTRALRILDGLHILQKYLRPTYLRDVSRIGRWSIHHKVASITPDTTTRVHTWA